jgi:hypothetical protein
MDESSLLAILLARQSHLIAICIFYAILVVGPGFVCVKNKYVRPSEYNHRLPELWKNCRKIFRRRYRRSARKVLLHIFHNSSKILPRLEEYGESGLAWGIIVE